MINDLLKQNPLLIAALHMPTREVLQGQLTIAWLEDYVAANLQVFAKGGIRAVKLQDEFLTLQPALPEVVALMAAIGRFARSQFPELQLGIILEAHDPLAMLAVANACGASFVRIKVYAGAMVKAQGVLHGRGAEALAFRQQLGAPQIALLADVHDRTGYSLAKEPIEFAAGQAQKSGADALILTGHSLAETRAHVKSVRNEGVTLPLIVGGGANLENIADILSFADGVVVSSTLKKEGVSETDIVQWDLEKVQRFVDAAQTRTAIPNVERSS
jgi:membrane complex biogenesis BtpA family protein